MAAISGNLPFGTMSPANGTNYSAAYDSALAMNSAAYTNILAGYNQSRAEMTTANDAIANGYTDLAGAIQQSTALQEQQERQAIQDRATSAVSHGNQNLIGRGLANTTVQSAMERGVAIDKGRSVNDLVAKMSDVRARYMSQIRQAGLQQRAMNAQQKAAMDRSMLDWMNSVNSPYPDAAKYAALQQQLGAARAAQANGMMGGGGGQQQGGGMQPRPRLQMRPGNPGNGRVQPMPGQRVIPAPMNAINGQAQMPGIAGPMAGPGAVPNNGGFWGPGGMPGVSLPPGNGSNGMNPGACPGGNCGPAGATPPGGTSTPPGSWGYGDIDLSGMIQTQGDMYDYSQQYMPDYGGFGNQGGGGDYGTRIDALPIPLGPTIYQDFENFGQGSGLIPGNDGNSNGQFQFGGGRMESTIPDYGSGGSDY